MGVCSEQYPLGRAHKCSRLSSIILLGGPSDMMFYSELRCSQREQNQGDSDKGKGRQNYKILLMSYILDPYSTILLHLRKVTSSSQKRHSCYERITIMVAATHGANQSDFSSASFGAACSVGPPLIKSLPPPSLTH